MESYDLVVVGGGPGGYVTAIRAAQLGLKTALVEKEHLGGTCLNWGCIPTKCLLQNAEVIHLLSRGKDFGFAIEGLSVDYAAAYTRSRRVVSRLTKGIQLLMKKNGITVYDATARLAAKDSVELMPTGQCLTAAHLVVATGARSRQIPGVACDGERVVTYRQALEWTAAPASAVIVGAGPIGMEFATLWNRYGSKVTMVEMLPQVLPLEDPEICAEAQRQFKRAGIAVKTDTRVEQVSVTADGVDVTVSAGGEVEVLPADIVLVAIGFAPNSEALGLETVGVDTLGGNIVIDDQMRTSVPTIYAVGDVTGKLGLAHAASAQGLAAAESIAGRPARALDYVTIPRCTYAYPEVASVGLTETLARERGFDVATVTHPFLANGKALATADNKGFVKIVSDAGSRRILGVHLIGGHVTELIAGAAGIITLKATVGELAHTVYPHPTVSEAIIEAVHSLVGHAIHG